MIVKLLDKILVKHTYYLEKKNRLDRIRKVRNERIDATFKFKLMFYKYNDYYKVFMDKYIPIKFFQMYPIDGTNSFRIILIDRITFETKMFSIYTGNFTFTNFTFTIEDEISLEKVFEKELICLRRKEIIKKLLEE